MTDTTTSRPKLLITGGTGLIGCYLVPFLLADYEITVITRSVAKAELILGKGVHLLSSTQHMNNLDAFDAVINLAGEPLFDKRWSPKQKSVIEQSRWQITQSLVELMTAGDKPPSVFLSGSAIGYYGRQQDQLIFEDFDQPFTEFSHQICKQWEMFALQASSDKTRVCLLRTGIVLAKNGGALDKMLTPFKLGLGGPIGNGEQYFSWIHLQDMLRAVRFLLENTHCQGAFNLTAPEPVTNKIFSQTLGRVLKRPTWLTTPAVMLKLMLGESADLLIHGQRVIPKALVDAGFDFVYPELEKALLNIKP